VTLVSLLEHFHKSKMKLLQCFKLRDEIVPMPFFKDTQEKKGKKITKQIYNKIIQNYTKFVTRTS